MGFADLSPIEIAEDYQVSVADVMALCDRLQIAYTSPHTRLALEDAKAIIETLLASRPATSENP